MTTIDLDALETAKAMREQLGEDYPNRGSILDLWFRTADALEATLAELRQERGRAEQKNGEADRMQAAALLASDEQERLFDRLQEAEAVIEAVRALPRHEVNPLVVAVDAHEIDAALARYKPTTENGSER